MEREVQTSSGTGTPATLVVKNWKTSLFGTLAALGVWAHESGVLAGTKWGTPVAILTALCMALAANFAKDSHAEDYQKQTTTEVKAEKTVTTETEKV